MEPIDLDILIPEFKQMTAEEQAAHPHRDLILAYIDEEENPPSEEEERAFAEMAKKHTSGAQVDDRPIDLRGS